MEQATKILSKSFDDSIDSNDSWLIFQIKQILALEESTPNPHKFSFSNNRNSAKINTDAKAWRVQEQQVHNRVCQGSLSSWTRI